MPNPELPQCIPENLCPVVNQNQALTDIPNTNIPLSEISLKQYLKTEIQTSTLDSLRNHLWMAGLPQNRTKPLHHQKVLRREIIVSERMHLISYQNTIYVKPIPHCLLHPQIFEQYIYTEEFKDLRGHVLGFLSTYLLMIRHESDLRIANELKLLPEAVDWSRWLAFSKDLETKLDVREEARLHANQHHPANQPRHPARWHFGNRYDFAELRLDRLNLIMILSWRDLRGYARLETNYPAYFRTFWSVITVLVFAFLSISLSAFQAATANTSSTTSVRSASHWFAVTALLLLATTVTLPSLWFLILFINNLQYTRKSKSSVNVDV